MLAETSVESSSDQLLQRYAMTAYVLDVVDVLPGSAGRPIDEAWVALRTALEAQIRDQSRYLYPNYSYFDAASALMLAEEHLMIRKRMGSIDRKARQGVLDGELLKSFADEVRRLRRLLPL
jgi:hypothetical protein